MATRNSNSHVQLPRHLSRTVLLWKKLSETVCCDCPIETGWPSAPDLAQMSWLTMCTFRGWGNVHYYVIIMLSGEGRVDPGQVKNGLREEGRANTLRFFRWLGCGTVVRVPACRGLWDLKLPEGISGLFFFFFSFSRCGMKGEGRRWAEMCQFRDLIINFRLITLSSSAPSFSQGEPRHRKVRWLA